MADPNPELESFRQQWRAEVTARARTSGNSGPSSSSAAGHSQLQASRKPPVAPRIAGLKASEDNSPFTQSYHDVDELVADVRQPGETSLTDSREPRTALEHYEKAVERENEGSLGDSLNLYRKAFRMDDQVDKKYKSKHFPPPSLPAKSSNMHMLVPTGTSTLPNAINEAPDGPPQTMKQLIAGFADLAIAAAPPAVEGTPAAPCHIAKLPQELLVHIFRDLAIMDVASFARMAQVCKRMAYLVATEDHIWKRVCEGSEVGFGAMHYDFQQEVLGGPLEVDFPEFSGNDPVDELELLEVTPPVRTTITEALLRAVYRSSWLQMFRLRPRVRFNGCYISTNNYVRPGQASANQLTWNSPVHIVTYFRYLRFFRDGTLISLLTTDEPADVVRHITKDSLIAHANKNANTHLPSVVMQNGLRGRWRLSPISEHPDIDLKDAEGDVCIETEGVGPKYTYRMDLSLRSSGKGAKNNKLVWRGFWSYNKLTDDWAEFSRRNEKPLYWSRVRSYGSGA